MPGNNDLIVHTAYGLLRSRSKRFYDRPGSPALKNGELPIYGTEASYQVEALAVRRFKNVPDQNLSACRPFPLRF